MNYDRSRERTISRRTVQCVLVVYVCVISSLTAAGQQRLTRARSLFTTVDFPGSVSTSPQGINPAGDIVGVYVDAQGEQHGFLLSHGVFSTIDFPGAARTDARGINPAGEIVGGYALPGENALGIHGYQLAGSGEFVSIDYPGHINTIPQRILPDGTVLGCYHDNDFMGSMHGFVLRAGQYTGFDMGTTMHNGATPDVGRIAGLFFDMTLGKPRAYVVQDGNFNALDFPGSIATQAWDENPSGAVVGNYTDTTHVTHGFLEERGQFTSIDFPGAMATLARGINPGGDVVGRYVDAGGVTHGFLASHAQHSLRD